MPLQSAAIADFNGDGRVDLLCADPRRHPQLFLADRNGRFEDVPKEIDAVDPVKEFSTSITVGDVNADGHLDVWLSQYKRPYHEGQMPTPYYDANDGYPAYRLINDGHGNFVDRTVVSGLGVKRLRRTYSSSLADLDGDSDLDLVVVSDFAGLDIYQNDGQGRFHNVTTELVDEPHNFGMSHAIADTTVLSTKFPWPSLARRSKKSDSSSQFSCSRSRETWGTYANAQTLTDQPAVGAPATTTRHLRTMAFQGQAVERPDKHTSTALEGQGF